MLVLWRVLVLQSLAFDEECVMHCRSRQLHCLLVIPEACTGSRH